MGIYSNESLILYAEDSPVEQELFKQALKERDFAFKVQIHNNGKEIITYLQKSDESPRSHPRPAIILLDWHMPIQSGQETLTLLKAHKDWKVIPVIIFSSHDNADIIQSAYEAYANAYIKKPLEFDELPKILQTIEDFWIKKVKLPPKKWDL